MDTDLMIKKFAELENRILVLEKYFGAVSKSPSPSNTSQKILSPKEFLLEKKPSGEVQKALVLCFYLEYRTGLSSFNIDDLEGAFRAAKEKVPQNLNDKINKNIDKGYLMEAKEKKDMKKAWVLTASGEKFISDIKNS